MVTSDWSTITADRGLASGVHYWEVVVERLPSREFMVGLVYPPDESVLCADELNNHLGQPGANSMLRRYSIGLHVTTMMCCKQINGRSFGSFALGGRPTGILTAAELTNLRSRVQQQSHNMLSYTNWSRDHETYFKSYFGESRIREHNHDGARLGFLLDMDKGEFRAYYWLADKKRSGSEEAERAPDSEHLVCTVHRGRRYYPAFSFKGAGTVLHLTVHDQIPTAVRPLPNADASACDPVSVSTSLPVPPADGV